MIVSKRSIVIITSNFVIYTELVYFQNVYGMVM